MWYPTKWQWLVIWISTVLCLVFWLARDPRPEAFVLPAGLVGALFVWQAKTKYE